MEKNALASVEGGVKRDSDSANTRPIGEGAQMPRRPSSDAWKDLAMVKAPTMIICGLRSDRWANPAVLERLTRDHAKATIVAVDAQDVADQARTRWWFTCGNSKERLKGGHYGG